MTEGTTAQVSSAPAVNNTNASPKKQKKTATKGKSSTASHPKYSEMIKAALKALNDRGGSSRAAILKFVLANYSLDPAQANQHLKLALKNGVKAKYFKQTKGSGASGSFKLASKTEAKPAKKKSVKPKKTTKSTTTTAASATKKRARSKSAGAKPAKKVAAAADSNNAAATPAAKPKKVQVAKPKTSAAPKSDNAAKSAKPKQTKPKKATAAKPAGAKKVATKKVAKPSAKKATAAKKPKSPAAKKPAAAKKAAKPKTAAKKTASPKKAAK